MNDGGYNHTMPEKPMHAHHKYWKKKSNGEMK